MEVKKHYDNHLNYYYTWIYGGFDSKVKENDIFFKNHNIQPVSTKIAIDLGAGSGFQSIPLAKIGFQVKAIDFSAYLLNELKNNGKNLDIEIIEDDILNFSAYSKYNPELIVCMGDTLTHLNNLDILKKLLTNIYSTLISNGRFITTFRDLTFQLEDEKRFIPVRSDENKIFTCFLEYFQDYIKVFDIVNEKENGKWNQKISWYKKIKISQENIKRFVEETGFKIDFFEIKNGMISLICRK